MKQILNFFLLGLLLLNERISFPQVNAADQQQNDDNAADNTSNNQESRPDLSSANFDQISILPTACVNYNGNSMIKYELYDSQTKDQCHRNILGTYMVSIGHYMRAYFNYRVLAEGENFKLPADAGYLNCVLLQETRTGDGKALYAKIGCSQNERYSSTKLRLFVFTDRQCSVPYDDGQSERKRNSKGYHINGVSLSTLVSFRPSFYNCQTCTPSAVSETFSKKNTYWYDDDAVSNGKGGSKYDDLYDDWYWTHDDKYFVNEAYLQNYVNNQVKNKKQDDDDFYTLNDDKKMIRGLRTFTAAEGELEKFENEFWHSVDRSLGGNNENYYRNKNYGNNKNQDDSVASWNMCQRVTNYGMWCDENCRAIDLLKLDSWSRPDIFLMAAMCAFMTTMMALIFTKRVNAYEKAQLLTDDSVPGYKRFRGFPPFYVGILYVLIIACILGLGLAGMVKETLIFSVVICILLFIYLLKLTLFDSAQKASIRREKLLASQHGEYQQPAIEGSGML